MLSIKKYPFKLKNKKEEKKVRGIVERIIKDVSKRGDEAIVYWTRKFDYPEFKKEDITVEKFDFDIEPEMETLVDKLKNRIEDFAKAQLDGIKKKIELNKCSQVIVPVKKTGIYVPSGKAPLFSSLLMSAIPAKVAGVEEIYIATPPNRENKISPYILFCAKILGIKKIFKVGGAQGVAGMALGTESIPKMDIIAGAGNKYVQEAKRILFGTVGIDTIAGPTEIVIIADDHANPEFVAWDLLSQAEHGLDSMAILITPSFNLARKVKNYVKDIISDFPEIESIKRTLKKNGGIILVENLEEAFSIANEIAPEHLSLQIKEPENWIKLIRNAGAVFVGDYSPVTIGDYWAGPSHILPTGGTSRFLSLLSVRTFLKEISVISFDREEFLKAKENVIALSEKEGLFAHAESIRARERYEGKNDKA
jgi:histidinol dehydrogenase